MPTSAPKVSANMAALTDVGTSVWLDQIRRSMIHKGELQRLVDTESLRGETSNPSIFEKAILGSSDYEEELAKLADEDADATWIYERLAIADVQDAADVMRPVYDEADATDGYVSMEVAPELARDTEGTIEAAKRLWSEIDRPNVMIKIPGAPEGLHAIRTAIAAGINVNVTLLFGVEAYEGVIDAYLSGLEDRASSGEPIDRIASVASFFVSRVDSKADALLTDVGNEDLLGQIGIANARLAYQSFLESLESDRWKALAGQGAQRQRPLWASTSVKNPRYRDTLYVEELAGPDTVNTMPMETLLAFSEHGAKPADNLTGTGEEAKGTIAAMEAAGVSLRAITEELLEEGIDKFAASMDSLVSGIEERREGILAGKPQGISARLADEDAKAIGERVKWAETEDVAHRIWRKDHTLWKPDPEEITNRLGWLVVAGQVLEHYDELASFALDAREEGMTDFCLLGMGGSSLCPEVLRRTFGPEFAGLRLHVLDSTHPETVHRIESELPLSTTIFCVSSKSGSTLEPTTFYKHFRGLVDDGSRFVAVTDPGTKLVEMAGEQGFRRLFTANPEIGGRYSALSHFGMVPGTAAGVDTEELLDRAEVAVHCAMPSQGCEEGAALWLGLCFGELTRRGRDKLTFVVDEPLDGFGLWAEQLVAESTGKEGTGIVPIADEDLAGPDAYGDDRMFCHLRNSEQPDATHDERLAALADAGHPVFGVPFERTLDIGGLFFTLEFAVATAGAVLGINAFNQPNVQQAKDLTVETIDDYVKAGGFPADEPDVTEGRLSVYGTEAESVAGALDALLSDAEPGRFFATLAYIPESAEATVALQRLRLAVRNAKRCATTVGYGPRYLHSTGQLHKGGPPSGIFLQITCEGREGVDVPGEDYDFAALVRAQSIGELKALHAAERTVLRVHVSGNLADGLETLADAVAGAVA